MKTHVLEPAAQEFADATAEPPPSCTCTAVAGLSATPEPTIGSSANWPSG
jgi:hypothetical protein